ncbi:MAG: glycosyltransferase family 39 protein [Planctomycetota bacterium]
MKDSEGSFFHKDMAVISLVALFGFLLHMVFNNGYGFHHDEMYFVACGERFAFGYVDQPPLVPWIAVLSRNLFDGSLRGMRLLPALFHAATILLTGLLARRLGGGRFAQRVSCIAVLIAPVYLRTGNLLCIPGFEPFYWVLCSYLIVRLIQEERPRLWLFAGLVAGVGLMTKHTMLFYLGGLGLGLLMTSLRKQLKSPWLWAGAGVAFLVLLPNLIWQMQNDWVTLKWLSGLNKNVMSRISTIEFLLGQILYLHPFNLPVWLAGLGYFFFSGAAKPYRFLGWIFVVVFAFLLVVNSKIYYLAPAFPMLLAGGGIVTEKFMRYGIKKRLRPAVPAVLVLGGALLAPVSLPILPIETTDAYIQVVTLGAIENSYEVTEDLHDQFGWEELVSQVAEAYDSLSLQEKGRCIILAADRGAASAIDYFGKARGLPPARCWILNYALWGYGGEPVDVIVSVGLSRETLDRFVNHVEEISVFTNEHVNPWRNNQLIAVCRDLMAPFSMIWPQLVR